MIAHYHRSEEEAADYADCPCGNHIERSAGSCCQGAVPDQCRVILCETCADDRKCLSCGLPVCDSHFVDWCGERWCHSCVGDVAKEASETVPEYEFEDQEQAEMLVAMAAGGCTLESMQDTGRTS